MNWKIGSHSFHLSLTVLAIAAGALFMYVHLGNGAALDAWLSSAHQEVATSRAWRARTLQLAGQADRARVAATQWQDSSTHLAGRFDSLLALLTIGRHDSLPPVSLGELGAACHAAIDACRIRGDSLASADSLDRIRADSAERRALLADSIIHAGIKSTQCHFLLVLHCPSREQAFLGGAGVALILRAILAK